MSSLGESQILQDRYFLIEFNCNVIYARCFINAINARYFIEFDGYNLFPLSSIFISSRSTFLGDLKITSSVFSTSREILFALSQYSNASYHG